MEKSVFDLTVDILHERQQDLRAELKTRFKKTKPFRTEPMDNKELIYYYDMLNMEDMQFLVVKHGEETLNDFIYEMETANRRMG